MGTIVDTSKRPEGAKDMSLITFEDYTTSYTQISGLVSSPCQCRCVDNRSMERLRESLTLQRKLLEYITEQRLIPLQQEMKAAEKPTLAQMARELRLSKLVTILEGSNNIEQEVTRWFNELQQLPSSDIQNSLDNTLTIIETENTSIRNEWFKPKPLYKNTEEDKSSVNNKNNMSNIKRLSKQMSITEEGSSQSTQTQSILKSPAPQPPQSTAKQEKRKSITARKTSFQIDPEVMKWKLEEHKNELETKIAHLHRSLHSIISALKRLVEAIEYNSGQAGRQQKLDVTGADVFTLLMNFPQEYVRIDHEQCQHETPTSPVKPIFSFIHKD